MSSIDVMRPGRLLHDGRVRGWLAQAGIALGVVGLVWFFVDNAGENLARSGVATGFDFMGARSGVDIDFKLIQYGPDSSYGRLLLVGIANTLFVSFFGILLATVLGFAVGIGRLSGNWLLAGFSTIYVEAVRNVPLLLFVLLWYYLVIRGLPAPRQSIDLAGMGFVNNRGIFLPSPTDPSPFQAVIVALAVGVAATWLLRRWARSRQDATGQPFPTVLAGVGLVAGLPLAAALVAATMTAWNWPALSRFGVRGGTTVIPEFLALLAALGTYTAAFIAEIVRGGILSVTRGQREAAAALGLNRRQILRLVVLPQAMRVIIPPLTSQYVNLIKNSSYAAVIAYPEIVSVFVGSALNNTGRAVEIIAITLAIYLAINVSVSLLMNWYDARTRMVGR
ncbi:general L-amino acid transport system permease protein [Stella humosa]|uniref:General L-amino acid transport system permease protein n=1 Tax=Stella humosa TaxID=94 RepID=A0A3N1L961_9PROT|nr:ABC transporter permease subunit [Stella humosa]ROP91233.1 general L-amino acid transport system permease protein [Stella humosa]BBK34413.1 amino acid ABC transporter permease [Stella humosa]